MTMPTRRRRSRGSIMASGTQMDTATMPRKRARAYSGEFSTKLCRTVDRENTAVTMPTPTAMRNAQSTLPNSRRRSWLPVLRARS